MNLKELLAGVACEVVQGRPDVEVKMIHFDSRKVGEGDLFIAQRGVNADGHEYITKAVAAGAVAVVCEEVPGELKEGVVYVKVLHTKDNSIEEMKMDEYLLGVVSAEMPADFEEEALKAQAVVARTYTVYKIEHNQSKHGEADICDNSACCQAWISKDDRMARWDEDKRESNWEKIEKAVSSTAGKVVTYNGEVIDAFFHSNSGGKTEEVSNVWGGSDLPYLQSVETSGEDAYSQYQSEATFTKEEFEKKIKDKYPEFTIDYNDENCIKVIEYTQGDRVKTIKIGNLELSGVEVRSLLALRSANFTTQISENEIKFTVKGYGHGVGMSQTGADSMAKQGSNYEEIIKHYYTGVEITNL